VYVCPECGWSQPTDGRCQDGTALASIGDDVLLGTQLGPYRIARLLGVGGMGRVYKAVQPNIGSRVAIKVLSRECTDRPDLVGRFFDEARAVNLFRHESIVNVLDLATLPDGRPYIVMEFLDGQPLSAVIARAVQLREPLPIGGVVRLVIEVLDAVGAAHARGIVHRDLKPDNVFVSPSGRAKVLDFGIAKLRPELGGHMTQTGSLLGTPHYMSPEQAQGMPVDHRTDLYAIGVILYEALTLTKPFFADSLFALLRMQIEVEPRPPRELRPDLPLNLDAMILTSLAKQPGERFAVAPAMIQALQHATAQLPAQQWAPLGGTVATWQGTPPSWVGRVSAPPPAGIGHVPTVMAGQRADVTRVQAEPSRRGLFVLAGLAILVLGAVAIALAVTRRDTPATVVAADHHHDDDDSARIEKLADDEIEHTMNKINQMVDRNLDQAMGITTPVAPAGSSSAAGSAIARGSDSGSGSAGSGAGSAEADATTTGPTEPALTADGWVNRRDLPYPHYDPHAVDVAAFFAFAIVQAKQTIPDAELTRADADNVDRTGHADLTLASFASSTGTIDVRFVSTSRIPPDPHKPKPFGFKWRCGFRIEADPDGVHIRDMDGFPCEDAVAAPRCTPTAVWTRVRAKLPASATRIDLDFRRAGVAGKPGWYYGVRGAASDVTPDGC
jgi:hypothetical protein